MNLTGRLDDCPTKSEVGIEGLSLRARQGVAIFWYCVLVCTLYQEIATGFALAMTGLPKAVSFDLAGQLSNLVGGVMTPPYRETDEPGWFVRLGINL